ncbi:MAG: tetratricopeptide repeat protein [bacterium]|nr:tetratricopeptide repeat protein [bacterium]
MKKKYLLTILLLIGIMPVLLTAQTSAGDKELLEKAKLELFDRNWDNALNKLNQLVKNFPDSSYYSQALFYKGKCLKEQGKTVQALEAYTRYLEVAKNESLRVEAVIAVIDLDFDLYKSGEKRYLKQITRFLSNSRDEVRYYAAFKLSYARDKKAAEAAVPVLKKIVASESDDELVDRARLRLMRINPDHLKKTAKTRSIEKQMLHIHVYNKKDKKETFSISIPFVLAKLALNALPDEDKKALSKKGYDVERLLRTLTEAPELIRIEAEETVFKIWVE